MYDTVLYTLLVVAPDSEVNKQLLDADLSTVLQFHSFISLCTDSSSFSQCTKENQQSGVWFCGHFYYRDVWFVDPCCGDIIHAHEINCSTHK